MLLKPKYIDDSKICDTSLRYVWDDWDLQSIFVPQSDEFHGRMAGLTHRSNIAFTIACAEWIVFRYEKLSDDIIPFHHLEASWAGQLDWRYMKYWEPVNKEWLGPIRGALSLGIIFVNEVLMEAEQYEDPAMVSAEVSNLAVHIMTDTRNFNEWRSRVIARLETYFPLDEADPLGDVVPREAMDPDFDFRPEMTEKLVQVYLDKLTPGVNPILRTPEQMIESGFKGTPYVFNMEEDRIARNDY